MDGRADQYSLGCVLFESLTGVVPFRRDSELAVLWAHVNDPPPRIREHRPDLPAALDDVIGRALAKAPGDRHPSCGALVAAAQAALAGTAPAGVRHRIGRAVGARARPRPPPALGVRADPAFVAVLTTTAGLLSAVLLVAAVLVARDDRAARGPGRTRRCRRRPTRRSASTRRPTSRMAAVAVETDPAAVTGGGGARLGRQPARRHRDRGRPRHQPGPGDHPGVRVRAGRPGRPRPRLRRREPLGGQRRPAAGRPCRTSTPMPPPSRWARALIAIAAAPDAVWVVGRTQGGGACWPASTRSPTRSARRSGCPTHRPGWPSPVTAGRPGWPPPPTGPSAASTPAPAGVVERIELPQPPDQAVFGDGAVWVTSSEGDAVMRIDAATYEVQEITVGNGPTGIAFGDDRVWVANSQDGTVSIDRPPDQRGRHPAPRVPAGRRGGRGAARSGSRWPPDRPWFDRSPPDPPGGCSLGPVAAPRARDDGAVEVGGEFGGGWLETADGVADPCAHRLAGTLAGGRPELPLPP